MPKDPAFLFYPGDWMGGTITLTRHQKGCYIDLLIAQFNDGPLSLETVKIVLGTDQAVWTVISKKFKKDSGGNFFNERLAAEIEKRKNFCMSKSHRNAGRKKSKDKSYDKSYDFNMNNRTENENINKDDLEGKEGAGGKETWDTMPGVELHSLELPDINSGVVQQHWQITKKLVITKKEIIGLWEVFKIQNLTGKRFYGDVTDVFSHFLNWTKTQKIADGNPKVSESGGKQGTSEARINALKNLR